MNKPNQINYRREFLKNSAAAVAGLGYLSFDSKARSFLIPEDDPNTHNMMIVGMKTTYLSHLPMFVNEAGPGFDSPHRFQVILEATFRDGNRDLTQVYAQDRLKNPSVKMYTLRPEEFVLSRLDPKGMALKKFRGESIFRGHLERRPRQRIVGPNGAFDVNIQRVVHFREFDPNATKPARLEYLLFGKGQEIFLAHFITKPDDFDQIISVKIAGQSVTDEQLAKGMHVVFSTRNNTAADRMKEEEKGTGEFHLLGAAPLTLAVEVTREFYFEETELLARPNMSQNAEEKKAGFK
jgi:hypothetical protein